MVVHGRGGFRGRHRVPVRCPAGGGVGAADSARDSRPDALYSDRFIDNSQMEPSYTMATILAGMGAIGVMFSLVGAAISSARDFIAEF